MRCAQLIVVLTCALGVVDADVQPDWGKLTDFSTKIDVALDASALPPPVYQYQRSVSSYKAHGEINLDLFGEKAYFKGHESYTLDGAEGHAEGHDAYEFYFDAVNGRVALKLQGTFPEDFTGVPGGITLEPSCVKIRFPQGMLPPPDMLKEQAEQSEPMVTQFLQQSPHTEATFDGESVQLYRNPNGPEAFAVRDDATPVFYSLTGPDADGTWNPQIKFTDWSQGANVPDDMTCTEMTPEELRAKPYAKMSLRLLDRVMALSRRMRPLQLAFRHLPAKPSLLFEDAAGTSLSVQSSTPGMMPTMALAFAAGTLASLLVFAVLKPRRSQGTPLLDNVA
jgi:hypothetical protein